MSTSKHFDKICAAVIAFTLIVTILFMNGANLGIETADYVMGYENRLFSTDSVHKIDIVMDDWDSFIETCENEEYSACTVLIDGEKYSNIAIRAKGNTSLSTVSSMGSDRYSLKLEFDHYESGKSYYGLDKLCLNNLIQDNTMMKDYLVYQMMAEFGVDTPLCSYVYITVNGEDWGLYLAVEGVEDSFLTRNYGSDQGELYKPDSMSFGGGRGNGKGFDMEDFDFSNIDADFSRKDADSSDGASVETESEAESGNGSEDAGTALGETAGESANNAAGGNFDPGNMPSGGQMPSGSQMPSGEDFDLSNMPQMPSGGQMPSGEDFDMSNMPQMPSGGQMPSGEDFDPSNISQMPDGMKGGFGGMGSDDVKLKYIDDDADSYSNIFDNAKTKVSDADKNRLIQSLKNLSEYTDMEETVDVEEVIRYFVVHNFVVNGDSYTGSMIHNYYLHEDDGQLSMIPWDYNLAFGTFQGGNASSSVNASIDNPVSGGSVDDRPMFGWILSDEEYTNKYHEVFSEFISEWIDGGKLTQMISETADLIRPYVEKDPTKFCTVEEFEKGVETISQFVTLRGEAVSKQLSGDNTEVDASGLNVSDMGTMNNGGGGGFGGFGGGDKGSGGNKMDNANESASEAGTAEGENETSSEAEGENVTTPEVTDGAEESVATPEVTDGADGSATAPEGGTPPEMPSGMGGNGTPPEMPNGMGGNGTPPNMPDGTSSATMQSN